MKKAYKLLIKLHANGIGLNLPKEGTKRTQDKRSYQGLLFTSEEMDKTAQYLIKKGYIDPLAYRSSDVLGSKLVISDKGSRFVTDYLNKPWYTKFENFLSEHKLLLGLIIFIVIIAIYLISGCKITDGFSAVDCTKTFIQK